MVMGEDVGRAGGVFRATAGLRERFGDEPLRRHAARRGRDPRQRGRALHGRLAAGLRDAVRRVLVSVPRPADHARRPLPLAHRREDGVPARRAHAVRRRRARAGAARRLAGDVLRAHARREGRDPVDAGRREGAARGGDPRSRSRRRARAEAHLPRTSAARCPRASTSCRSARRGSRARATDVTLVAYGAMVPLCERAADALEGEASVEVLDVRTLKPLDEDALLASAAKTGRVVIVQEAPRTAGFGAELAAILAEKAILDLHGPVLRVTGFDVPYPYWKIEDRVHAVGRARRRCRPEAPRVLRRSRRPEAAGPGCVWLERGESGYWLRDAATGDAMQLGRRARCAW